MANKDNAEFDVLINGKPAKKTLEDIKKELGEVDKKNEKTTKSMNMNWVAVGATIAITAAAFTKMTMASLQLERATFGLTDATKEYINQASIQYGMNQDMIAGFIQTGKAAGMSGDEIETMIDQAVALGRKFPHESIETFVDNLSMLNRTGEAQGFIVDVLETKYGTLDLKALSLADKMRAVEETTAGVNDEFDRTNAAKVDKIYQNIENSVVDLSTEFNSMAANTGILDFLNDVISVAKKMVGYFSIGLQSVSASFVYMKATAQKAISDILWSMKDIAGIGDIMKEKANAMNTEYNVTIDQYNQMVKNMKEQVQEQKNLTEEKKKTAITGIEGKVKPKTQQELEAEIKKNQDIIREREKLKAELKRIEDNFNNDYISSLADSQQREIINLSNKYNEYAKYITDKAALDEWYNNEVAKIMKEDEKATDEYKALKDETFAALTDSFVTFAQTGKLSFKDMANSIIADLIRIQVQKLIVGSLTGTSVGGLLGFHTGTAEVKHTGGVIGNYPTYHDGGLMNDERLVKAQVGEGIVNRAGNTNNKGVVDAMNAGYKVGGEGGNVTTAEINFNVQAIDSASFNAYLVGNRQTIEGIINKSISSNGSVRKTINQSV